MSVAFRMQSAEQAGYGASDVGKVVVQYYDRDAKVWFDIGDPLTRREARSRIWRLRDGTYDLPEGYRWADADETERINAGDWPSDGYLVVPRTFSSNGHRYTQGEADIAVPK